MKYLKDLYKKIVCNDFTNAVLAIIMALGIAYIGKMLVDFISTFIN